MTFQEVTLDQLLSARKKLMETLKQHFSSKDYDFLLSFKKGEPNWELFEHPNIKNLPAIKWKLQNIKKIDGQKKKVLLHKLQIILNDWL